MKYQVYNQEGKTVGERELNAKVFGVKFNADLVHQAVVAQQANERPVLAHTKIRSEVRGGGKKPWRQKGTGRARVGSSRSPIWRSGGVTFGPTKDRNFSLNMNKKMKQKALLMALSAKASEKNLVLVDAWQLPTVKTKVFNQSLQALEQAAGLGEKRSWLIVNNQTAEVKRAGRNLAYTKIINLDNINIVDLLKYKNLLLSADVLEALEKKYV